MSEFLEGYLIDSEINSIALGKFEEDLHGFEAYEFVSLKLKMYGLKSEIETQKEQRTKATVRSTLWHQDYMECLKGKKTSLKV